MKISEQQINIPAIDGNSSVIEQVSRAVESRTEGAGTPVRWAMIGPEQNGNLCEFDSVQDAHANLPSIFDFRRRGSERTGSFNAAMLIPTGVDCAIGGHAGDATPSARLLAGACDHLVLHPNVVNASDINEQAPNCLYVEGSLICRLLMGTAALRKVRKNRVLLVTEERPDAPSVVEQTINCAEGARATLGMDMTGVVVLPEGLSMKTGVSPTGRVTGCIERMQALVDMLASRRGEYDAIALATKITPHIDSVELHHSYFEGGGANPWGGVEAVLTHTISAIFNVPSAHAPTLSSTALRTESWGVVEPRKAAEVISTTYLFCVLKGLHQAPRVEMNYTGGYDPSVLAAEDISALVIPDGCVGLPTLAALEQGIPVIAVRGNTNLMRNDLKSLPFAQGQLMFAENYYEAAGMLSALKMGVTPSAVVRPMLPMPIYRGVEAVGKAATNGKSNGKVTHKVEAATNGHTNGHQNGHSNGHTNGKHVATRA